jgi:hypothetical protein
MSITTYTIAESQLVREFHYRPETAWYLPRGEGVTVVNLEVGDFGGQQFADVLTLSDGRVAVVADDYVHLFRCMDDAWSGDNTLGYLGKVDI